MLREYAHLQLSQTVQLALPMELVVGSIAVSRTQICPIPGVANAILGVVNRGGKLVWVLDLADFLAELLTLESRSPSINPSSTSELTLVVIRDRPLANPANSDPSTSTRWLDFEDPHSHHLAWVVPFPPEPLTLNPTAFQPIPQPWASLLSAAIARVAWLDSRAIALLNVSAIFDALRTAASVPTSFTLKSKSQSVSRNLDRD